LQSPPPLTNAEPEPEIAASAPEVQAQEEEEEEDPEQARRRVLAERMAKLGGIRFGAGPPILPGRPAPSAPRPAPPEYQEQREGASHGQEAAPEQPPEEEDGFARKQRIAAKLASMGGMRIGMLPPAVPPARKAPVPVVEQEQEESHEYEEEQAAESSEYTPYEAEAGQPEEEEYYAEGNDQSNYLAESTQDEPEEEAPPIPSRAGRRVSDNNRRASMSPPPPPARGMRPPIPTTPSMIPSRKASLAQPEPAPQTVSSPGFGRYEDEPEGEEETPPPPPPRPTRPPPPPVAAVPSSPPPPPPPQGASSQWGLPSIPKASIDFGDSVDLSLSSFQESPAAPAIPTKEDLPAPPPPPRTSIPPPAPVPVPVPASTIERNYNPDELMAVWGKVGVLVLNSATELFEQSKRTVVGDGSYAGFVQSVLSQVPDVLPPAYETGSWGYLIYSQTGSSVQRRAAEILPGDVITLSDAKFKGHKGLQSYQLSVGVEEPVMGVVNEVETKKMKLKVFQANQHVGQQVRQFFV
jgi:myosin tail region-interacting protein MTI1